MFSEAKIAMLQSYSYVFFKFFIQLNMEFNTGTLVGTFRELRYLGTMIHYPVPLININDQMTDILHSNTGRTNKRVFVMELQVKLLPFWASFEELLEVVADLVALVVVHRLMIRFSSPENTFCFQKNCKETNFALRMVRF